MNEPDMQHSDDDTVVLRLFGEYDIYRKDELDARLSEAYEASVAVLDMREVSYIDSTAIACLIRLRRRMTENGSTAIRIAGPQPNVRKVLKLTGLDELFEIYDTLEEAAAE